MDARTGMPRVGMVGGGQLARMTHQAAIPLGQSLRVLAESADDSAALVAADVEIGSHTDADALRRFAAGCDVITFDHEHVPNELIAALTAEGHTLLPSAPALLFAQDKGRMRIRLSALGLPVPAFVVLPAGGDHVRAVTAFADDHGWPVVLKTCRGGYDGRGVWVLRDIDGTAGVLAGLPTDVDLLVEELVPLHRELAAVVARSPFGQAAAWPVVETIQHEGICVEVLAPAPELSGDRAVAAEELALQIAAGLDVVGVLAVELFEVEPSAEHPAGLVINELAMRPHNSAHWTQDGAVTSQFEQHLRAVLDYPLGATGAVHPWTVMANVIGAESSVRDRPTGMDERVHHLGARFPTAKVHLYGKSFRPGRKLGHVNVGGSALPEVRRVAQLAAAYLSSGVWADGYLLPPHGTRAVGGASDVGADEADGVGAAASHRRETVVR